MKLVHELIDVAEGDGVGDHLLNDRKLRGLLGVIAIHLLKREFESVNLCVDLIPLRRAVSVLIS